MKKITRRATLCLIIAAMLFLGLTVFIYKFVAQGSSWASFASNRHMYTSQGTLISGRILDRNGEILSQTVDGVREYNDNSTIRKATLHAVGDSSGYIGTGAQTAFADKLSGYNLITGAYGLVGLSGNDLYLTIDAEINKVAYEALSGRNGTVGVYNYKTGEVVAMVSTPTFDPENPPSLTEIEENPTTYDGVFVNRLLSATFTPGSVFKVLTLQAAIDNIDDLESRTFYCDGSEEIGGVTITCTSSHGEISIGDAVTHSCNITFGLLANEVGSKTMMAYVEQAGLTSSLSVSGISTAAGSFDFPENDAGNLAWAGIGQHNDLTNPLSFMAYIGAIANDGDVVYPRLISKSTTSNGIPTGIYRTSKGSSIMSSQTAQTISDMMRAAVVDNYGDYRFEGMELCAKSGTAEVGGDKLPNAWFAGFSRDEDFPYAFVVMIEDAGSGNSQAGDVASKVLTALKQQ